MNELLEALKKIDATPPGELAADATPTEKNAHALHTDACSHVMNAIDALERALAGKR